jgi:hypothetical protein
MIVEALEIPQARTGADVSADEVIPIALPMLPLMRSLMHLPGSAPARGGGRALGLLFLVARQAARRTLAW